MLKRRKNLLFVNKKKQKSFVNWSAPATEVALQVAKVFCFFFSKKMLPSFDRVAGIRVSAGQER